MSAFPYRIVVRWSGPDDAFVAEVPALPGAGGDAPTAGDAVREAEASARAQLAAREQHGDPIPQPDAEEPEFSGQLRLRMPKSLHRELATAAEREGVSLNQLMVTYLAMQVGASQSAPLPLSRPIAMKLEHPIAVPIDFTFNTQAAGFWWKAGCSGVLKSPGRIYTTKGAFTQGVFTRGAFERGTFVTLPPKAGATDEESADTVERDPPQLKRVGH